MPGAKENLVQSLYALGLNADEGIFFEEGQVKERGECGPYEQSRRLEIYKKYASQLVEEGKAYYCFCSPERLEKVRAQMMTDKLPPKYDKHCLSMEAWEREKLLKKGQPSVIRLNVAKEEDITFQDLVRGEVTINTKQIDDQVLIKSDGFPTYHLAVVVDDHLMGITHILRSEEWLPSTPKHILLFRAFSWPVPEIGHVSFILGPDGKKKLSKRDGGVAVEDFLRQGYLKEALLNFLALLGWNPGSGSTQEIFSLSELEKQFDVTGLHKAGAAFDRKKLDWMNGEYIKKLSQQALFERMVEGEFFDREFVKAAPEWMQSESYLKKVLAIEQERLLTLGDFGKENLFFFRNDPQFDKTLLPWKQNSLEETKKVLEKALNIAEEQSDDDWNNREHLHELFFTAAGDKRGDFLWPMRAALTGVERSPSPTDVAWVLGKAEVIKRLKKAISLL